MESIKDKTELIKDQTVKESIEDIIILTQLLQNNLESAEEDTYIIRSIALIEKMLKQLNEKLA